MKRQKRTPAPLIVNEFSRDDLQHICDVLNGVEAEAEVRSELEQLVHSWRASGPNLDKMMHSTGLWSDVQESWKVVWFPTKSGDAQLALLPHEPKEKRKKEEGGIYRPTAKGTALAMFYLLTIHPEWDRLGGPCSYCHRFFVMKTARNSKYCSRRCGSQATATGSTRRRLDREHTDKLRRAQAAQQQWLKTRTRTHLDWKPWVCRMEPDITRKWLTRAVNKGELKSP